MDPDEPARPLRRLLAGAPHAVDSSTAAGPAAASASRPTAATPGTKLARNGAAARRRSAASASPSRRPIRERVWAIVEAEDGGVFRSRRRRADLEAGQRASATCASAPGTTPTSTPTRRTRTRSTCSTSASTSRTTAARPSPTIAHAARRQPRPVDRARRSAAHDRRQRRRRQRHASTAGGPGPSRNQPTAQFYHVTIDNDFPYRVYGAQQDNSTVRIASRTAGGGIDATRLVRRRRRRERLHRADARRPEHRLRRLATAACSRATTTAPGRAATSRLAGQPDGLAAPKDLKYRFQWTFPIVFSPHDPKTLYAAAQHALQIDQRGAELGGDQPRPDAQRRDEAWAPPAGRSPRTTPASSTTARSSPLRSRRSRRA